MEIFQALAVLIEYPFLIFVPISLLLFLYWISKKRFVLFTAILWLAYLPYEYAMKYRILCSGECNIRIDLLLLYPLLMVTTVAALIVFGIALGKRKRSKDFAKK